MLVKELDVVCIEDGRTATVLEVFEDGEAYLLEIANSDGKTIETKTVSSDEITSVVWTA